MADLSEAIFTSLDTIRAADTGAGGLAQTGGGVAFLNYFVQRDDPNYDEDRAMYWPLVVVDVIEKDEGVWGTTSAPSFQETVVRLTIYTQRDPGRASQNAVSARIKAQFDGVTPANQTGWFFGPLALSRAYQIRAKGNAYAMVHEYVLQASDTIAGLIGRQGSVTFSGSEGSGIGSTIFGQAIRAATSIPMADVTYWHDQADRLTRRGMSGTITARFLVASHTPIIPVGTQGVLVFFLNTAGTKKITYTNAVVSDCVYDNGSAPTTLTLTFRVSATGSTIPGTIPMVAA